MQSREEPLTKRERAELQGYLSWSGVVTRAALFVLAVAAVAALFWRVRQWFPIFAPVWLLPPLAFAVFLYTRARRWSGGRALRDLIRRDLEENRALVHHVTVRDAIVFEEGEDEGPIVFVLTEETETLVFSGQELSRHVERGFPWAEFEIRETASSHRFLGLKRLDEPITPSAIKPPLSWEQFQQLGIASVVRWQRLDVSFDRLRHVT